jgi:hypothetical protein
VNFDNKGSTSNHSCKCTFSNPCLKYSAILPRSTPVRSWSAMQQNKLTNRPREMHTAVCSTVDQNERLNVKVFPYSTRSRGSCINRRQLKGTNRARNPMCVAVLLKENWPTTIADETQITTPSSQDNILTGFQFTILPAHVYWTWYVLSALTDSENAVMP